MERNYQLKTYCNSEKIDLPYNMVVTLFASSRYYCSFLTAVINLWKIIFQYSVFQLFMLLFSFTQKRQRKKRALCFNHFPFCFLFTKSKESGK